MNRITKTFLSLFFVGCFASIRTIQAQPVRGVWVNTYRTIPHVVAAPHIHRHAKKGSILSASSAKSNMASNKQAFKLAKKSRAPTIFYFKPDAPRLETPMPIPVTITATPPPHKFRLPTTMDPKPSEFPSDAPSLVPTVHWGITPTDFPTNGDGGDVTDPDNSTIEGNRTFDISPHDPQRMLPKDVSSTNTPTSGPTSNPTSSDAPATADDSSIQAEAKAGDKVTSASSNHATINLPTPAYVLICLAVGFTGMATYFDNKWRTRRIQEEEGAEAQFVNN